MVLHILLFLLVLAPTIAAGHPLAWGHEKRCYDCPAPCDTLCGSPEPCAEASRTPATRRDREDAGPVASLELGIGLGTEARGSLVEGNTGTLGTASTGTLLEIVPSIEWPSSLGVAFGIEVAVLSVDDPLAPTPGRRAVIAPSGRARLTFPIGEYWAVNATFSLGFASWASDGEHSHIGWTYRGMLGGGFRVSEGLWAFGGLGWRVVTAQPENDTFSREVTSTQVVSASSVPLVLGVRSGF